MRFPKACKLHKVCTEESRYMSGAMVDRLGEATVLVATDGRRLAVVHVDATEDPVLPKPGQTLIPAEALQEAVKRQSARYPEASVTVNGAVFAQNRPGSEVKYEVPDESEARGFPDWRAVLDMAEARGTTARVSLNARYLWELAQAIGAEQVTIEFRGDGDPMTVRPVVSETSADPANFGLLMPLKLS